MDAVEKLQVLGKDFEDMMRNGRSHKIKIMKPIGYLRHEPTNTSITVYKPISRFKALMLRWCFGLKYEKL
ncbi:MAG: hypothetical protein Q4E63_02795 [Prevotellaceae bacterium]|nr:hypothetical protein [Prevotellaceae bacterium]